MGKGYLLVYHALHYSTSGGSYFPCPPLQTPTDPERPSLPLCAFAPLRLCVNSPPPYNVNRLSTNNSASSSSAAHAPRIRTVPVSRSGDNSFVTRVAPSTSWS